MIGISEKQGKMLAFIQKFAAKNGYPPTYEEIRNGLNISSKSLVNYHLSALEDAQLLTRVPNTPRGIRLRSRPKATQLPLVKELASPPTNNQPALNQVDVLELAFNCINDQHNLFALQVNDDTATDDYARSGDIIILERPHQVENGELIALQLAAQPQLSLKRYFRENGHVRLASPNPGLNDIFAKPADVEIRGKVVAVIRQTP